MPAVTTRIFAGAAILAAIGLPGCVQGAIPPAPTSGPAAAPVTASETLAPTPTITPPPTATPAPELQPWSLSNAASAAVVDRFPYQGYGLVFSPDGDTLYAHSANLGFRVWDMTRRGAMQPSEFPSLATPVAHFRQSDVLVVSPDGRLLASAITTGLHPREITIWHLPGFTDPLTFNPYPRGVKSLAFTPDSRLLISTGSENEIVLSHVDTGKPQAVLFPETGRNLTGVALGAGDRLFVAGDYNVQEWSLSSQKQLRTVEPFTMSMLDIAASPASGLVAVLNDEVTVWDTATEPWTRLCVIPAQTDPVPGVYNHVITLAFDPSGTLLAFAMDARTGDAPDAVRVVDPRTGATVTELVTGGSGSIFDITFSPDGRLLVVGTSQDEVQMWGIVASR